MRPITKARSIITGTSIVAAAACARATPNAAHSAVTPTPSPSAAPASVASRTTVEDAVGLYDWQMYGRANYAWVVGLDPVRDITGTLDIFRQDGQVRGMLTSSIGPAFPARCVTVDGNDVTVIADTPYGEFRLLMTLGRDSIPAAWSISGGTAGDLTGKLGVTRKR